MTVFRSRSDAFSLRRAHALFPLLAVGVALCTVSVTAAAVPPAIALLDCVVLDDNAAYNDPSVTQTQQARATMVSAQLRTLVDQRGLYKVADNRPAATLIDRLQATQDLSSCNGCEREIARQLGAQRVGVCWVQKVSNLILNINLRIEDTASGQVVFQRSVDIRGNTDQSWRRGVDALVGLLASERDTAH
ncbi:DUF3280 domain-containing protein [Paraburkholderia azotifigens]|uniref:DUF2380 domain-containing protein n=1 Tax=Paraburkholderia azotifigens TaxID=2057004 RepID=A0A5C6V3B5_9BURK|nr:DUF3280 domain-containing protein [Paraburkholderia azotifigens]TXC79310.1 DUF2380 domain-containing protein [Paraburkholderia azotifigens]